LGVITDERFSVLYGGYEAEQALLSSKLADLRERLAQEDSQRDNMENFLALIGRYFDITELNAVVLNDLIDCIVIYTWNRDLYQGGFWFCAQHFSLRGRIQPGLQLLRRGKVEGLDLADRLCDGGALFWLA